MTIDFYFVSFLASLEEANLVENTLALRQLNPLPAQPASGITPPTISSNRFSFTTALWGCREHSYGSCGQVLVQPDGWTCRVIIVRRLTGSWTTLSRGGGATRVVIYLYPTENPVWGKNTSTGLIKTHPGAFTLKFGSNRYFYINISPPPSLLFPLSCDFPRELRLPSLQRCLRPWSLRAWVMLISPLAPYFRAIVGGVGTSNQFFLDMKKSWPFDFRCKRTPTSGGNTELNPKRYNKMY